MYSYLYRSSVGVFEIKPDPRDEWCLHFNNKPLRCYERPEHAASDVYMQCTGCGIWDSRPLILEPYELSDWVKLTIGHEVTA